MRQKEKKTKKIKKVLDKVKVFSYFVDIMNKQTKERGMMTTKELTELTGILLDELDAKTFSIVNSKILEMQRKNAIARIDQKFKQLKNERVK